MPRSRKRCPLCGSTTGPFNYEDSIPEWVRARTAKQGPFLAYEDGKRSVKDRPRRFRTPVCRSCNDWMNTEFENPAIDLLKELFTGWTRTLAMTEQRIVARWVAKTALMLRLHRRDLRPYPATVYHAFRQTGSPPSGMHIWLGTYGMAPPTQTPTLEHAPAVDLRYGGCYGTTLQIEHLVAQTLHCLLVNVGTLKNGAEQFGLLREIWPPTVGVTTSPPPFTMNDPSFEAVANQSLV
jgi:hypothetical protein